MRSSLIAALLLLASPFVQAQDALDVKEAWVRATVPAQTSTGAFMQLLAPAGGRLVSAKSPVAGTVEIHEMALENNVMKMRAVSGVDLPPGKTLELKPGGYHVMLMGLKKPIAAGDHVMLTLVFEGRNKKRSNIEVHAMARPINTMGNPAPKGEAMKMAH